MNDFPNVSFIIIGSEERLSKVKSYQIEDGVECLLCPFLNIDELPSLLDSKIAELDSIAISIIPAGAFPKKMLGGNSYIFQEVNTSFGVGIILEISSKGQFKILEK